MMGEAEAWKKFYCRFLQDHAKICNRISFYILMLMVFPKFPDF